MSETNYTPASERWRNNLLAKAGVAAGILAMTAATVKPQSSEAARAGYDVGFTDNSIFTENLSDAEATAAKIAAMGGTVVRFFYPLNKGTAWQNYAKETCNAFQAAYDHSLQPIVAFRGLNTSGSPGYVPQTLTEIKNFATTAASIEWTIASKTDKNNPGGCVQNQKHFVFEGINEINNGWPFNASLGINTPAQADLIDSQVATALKKEAAKPEIDATVSYGESLAAGNHDPIQFLNNQSQAAAKMGIKVKYDFVDIHPYPKDPTADPSLIMQSLYRPAKDAINTLSPGAQLVFGEIGVNTTNPPAAEATAYTPPVSNTVGVSEATQVKYITNVLKIAASEGLPWLTLFDVKDDGRGSMPASGEYYADDVPKSSQPAIQYQIGKYTGR